MALNPLNSSNLEQLALKGLKVVVATGGFISETTSTRARKTGSLAASTGSETGRTAMISTRLSAID